MKPAYRGLAILTIAAAAVIALAWPGAAGKEADGPLARDAADEDPVLATSAIGAVIRANGGKTPATGEELVKALAKVDQFAQFPVPFSAVHLESGIANPRVVLTPKIRGLSDSDLTRPNLEGRLFLAANMEKGARGGDPRVTSVEFISWNTSRRQFDFGVIENMGNHNEPQLRVVDGGRCFSCHKNRGPILGASPWSNSTQDDILRLATAAALRLNGSKLPTSGPFVLQPTPGVPPRDRIDGLALATPEAADVDFAVRLGANLRLNRDTFRLMTRSPDGRKALVHLLVAVVEPGPLDPNDKTLRNTLDATFDRSYVQFAKDWVDLYKATPSSFLIDAEPAGLLEASGVRPRSPGVSNSIRNTVSVPGLVGGSGSRWFARPGSAQATRRAQSQAAQAAAAQSRAAQAAAAQAAAVQRANDNLAATLAELAQYETARSLGFHGLTSAVQPSNPKAFVKPPAKASQRPSGIVNHVLLTSTIGLTEGDRKFLARTLADAAKRVNKPRATAPALARAVFEGPEFADFLAGGPLPDRDEFKDRFVDGLDTVLKTGHGLGGGTFLRREEYASGPKYDPKQAEVKEIAVMPTTACLRCHDVRGTDKPRAFEPIPALAFDPFDKARREAWLKVAEPKRKKEVLTRLQVRLFADNDMPPEDAPEYNAFRVKAAPAFDELKALLKAELEQLKGR